MNELHGISVNTWCEEKNLKIESLTQRLRERAGEGDGGTSAKELSSGEDETRSLAMPSGVVADGGRCHLSFHLASALACPLSFCHFHPWDSKPEPHSSPHLLHRSHI